MYQKPLKGDWNEVWPCEIANSMTCTVNLPQSSTVLLDADRKITHLISEGVVPDRDDYQGKSVSGISIGEGKFEKVTSRWIFTRPDVRQAVKNGTCTVYLSHIVKGKLKVKLSGSVSLFDPEHQHSGHDYEGTWTPEED